MSVTVSRSALLVGLPETGKTTFLAALWHIVSTNQVVSSLKLRAYDGDYEYLQTIRKAWLQMKPVPRTGPLRRITLDLVRRDQTNSSLRLEVPDVSGETYRSQWTERAWAKDFGTRVDEAHGVLLFVNPDNVKRTPSIDVADAALAGLAVAPTESGKKAHRRKTSARVVEPQVQPLRWEPDHASSQVVNVELLQFIADAVTSDAPLSLALIVSAWDRVVGLAEMRGIPIPTPDAWVRAELPLLGQYLDANPERFRLTYFGVSAQGGRFNDNTDRRRLQSALDPAERVTITDSSGRVSHDVTAPVDWLLE